MKPRRRTSQRQIAEAAGVSQAVVSHVLNNSEKISITAETRERVLRAIREFNYVPNKAAQSLRLQRTRTVAVVIPNITNPYYPEYVRGIQDVLMESDYDVTSYNSDGRFDLEVRGLKAALRSHADGIIGVFFHLNLEMLRSIVGDEQPLVLGTDDRISDDLTHLPYDTVAIEGVEAGRLVTDYLIQQGYRRIAMLSGQRLTPPRESRVKGFKASLTSNGIPASEQRVFDGEFDEEGGYKAMVQALQMKPLPEAIFAANDLIAIGAMRACRDANIKVPEQIAIAGFDNIPASRMTHPPLTTLDQFSELTGRKAAELMVSRLTGRYVGPPRREEIPVKLIRRGSA